MNIEGCMDIHKMDCNLLQGSAFFTFQSHLEIHNYVMLSFWTLKKHLLRIRYISKDIGKTNYEKPLRKIEIFFR